MAANVEGARAEQRLDIVAKNLSHCPGIALREIAGDRVDLDLGAHCHCAGAQAAINFHIGVEDGLTRAQPVGFQSKPAPKPPAACNRIGSKWRSGPGSWQTLIEQLGGRPPVGRAACINPTPTSKRPAQEYCAGDVDEPIHRAEIPPSHRRRHR